MKKQTKTLVGRKPLPEPVLRSKKPTRQEEVEQIAYRCRRGGSGTENVLNLPEARSVVAEIVDLFSVHVTMVYAPKRQPALVNLSIGESTAARHQAIQCLPMMPAEARKLAGMLIDMADEAEDMDSKPYPNPEDVVPPLGTPGT